MKDNVLRKILRRLPKAADAQLATICVVLYPSGDDSSSCRQCGNEARGAEFCNEDCHRLFDVETYAMWG